MSTPVVEKEKQACPHCGKKVLHMKQHVRNMHSVAPPLPPLPPPTVDLLEPEPEPELLVVEKTPEPVVVPEEQTPPPSPPPEKETFASVAAKVPPPIVVWKPLAYVFKPGLFAKGENSVIDASRVVNNVFKFVTAALPGRKSEWGLLTSLWQDTPARFQISRVHSTGLDPRPRITITVWRDTSRTTFSIYHIFMNQSAFAKASHVEGLDCGVPYRIVEFVEKV
jgi:hypothetical protein